MNTNEHNLSIGTLASVAALLMTVFGTQALAETGEGVYQSQCAACHGPKGAGDGPRAGQDGTARPRAFTVSVTERMVVEKAMMLGVNNVPGHGNARLLASQELQQLIDHVNRLAHP